MAGAYVCGPQGVTSQGAQLIVLGNTVIVFLLIIAWMLAST